jgi:hypothetical protein
MPKTVRPQELINAKVDRGSVFCSPAKMPETGAGMGPILQTIFTIVIIHKLWPE